LIAPVATERSPQQRGRGIEHSTQRVTLVECGRPRYGLGFVGFGIGMSTSDLSHGGFGYHEQVHIGAAITSDRCWAASATAGPNRFRRFIRRSEWRRWRGIHGHGKQAGCEIALIVEDPPPRKHHGIPMTTA
jgi:hypothetical protein